MTSSMNSCLQTSSHGNIIADFVRLILALFFRNILTLFRYYLNTDLPSDRRWQESSGTMHTWCSTHCSATPRISLHNYLGTNIGVNLAGTAHLVNIVQAALSRDLLAYPRGDIVLHFLVDTQLAHLFSHSVAQLRVIRWQYRGPETQSSTSHCLKTALIRLSLTILIGAYRG